MTSKRTSKKKKAQYQGFVNVSLTKQRKEAINGLFNESADAGQDIECLADAGYKITVSYSENPAFYTATAMQTDPNSDHAGYCTSARHSDLSKSLFTLRYYVEVILEEEGWPLNNGDMAW